MNLVVLDFETYYDDEYSLSKMSTEEYVCDPRFEIICVSVKINNAKPICYSGPMYETGQWLRGMGIYESAVIAHNSRFDMLILKVHFKRLPKMMLDTMGMAQAVIKPFTRSVSLSNCAEYLDLPTRKGTYVASAKGRHRQAFSKSELREYMDYCDNDCDTERHLFDRLLPSLPRSELAIIDMTLRMYLQPQMALNPHILAENLQAVISKKAAQIASLPAAITKDRLSSNPKFAELLMEYGIEPPMKTSPKTGLETFAFAKNDAGWKDMEEEYLDDPLISCILTARLGAKSTLEETRSKRLLDIANAFGWFRVPLRYHAAHTGRYGGDEKINATNLPQMRRSTMRNAVYAPQGKVILAADLEQIECRLMATIAGQNTLVQAFANGEDIYAQFASLVFQQEVVKGRSKEDDKMRFAGKTCILGLQYGMSAVVLMNSLRKDGLLYDLAECTRMVSTYRNTYRMIPMLWKALDKGIQVMGMQPQAYKHITPITMAYQKIVLPNGMMLTYNNLRYDEKKQSTVYDFGHETRKVWGGKIAENVMQALARGIIMDYMLTIFDELDLRPALQQHDELDYVVDENKVEEIKAAMTEIMVVPPEYLPNLPMAVEINYGRTLGDCK